MLNKLTKNPNARRNKLTNNHVSLRRREHEVNISRQTKQRMESFKWTCQVYHGKVKTMSRNFFHSKAFSTVVVVKALPSRFKYIISTGRKCSGAKHSFIVFGFVLARRGFNIYQVWTNLTLSHPVSVVNMMEENTRVAETPSDDEFSSVVIPYPLRLPQSTIMFANLRIK